MMLRVNTSIDLRPILSPKCPNSTPPIGRATNAAENVTKESNVPIKESNCGKKRSLKTSPAAVP